MKKLLLLLIFLLSGCLPGTPNYIDNKQSSFDGSDELLMESGYVYNSHSSFSIWDIRLGLSWNSRQQEDIFIIAEVPGEIVNIRSNDGLMFNIDGKIFTLSALEELTDFDSSSDFGHNYRQSKKAFPCKIDFIRKLVEAKTAKVKLITGEGSLEGDFSVDRPGAAIRGFKDFLEKIPQG